MSVSKQEIDKLKSAYEILNSLPIAAEYGPLRRFYVSPEIADLWSSVVLPAVQLVENTTHKVSEGIHVAEAPSPWHACFYLRYRQQQAFQAGLPPGETPYSELPTEQRQAVLVPKTAIKAVGDHMFFRGHRCKKWHFNSALRRVSDPSKKAIEQRAVFALEAYFNHFFIEEEDLGINTALCFAQHYGIATDLIDVTCDPDVAVWFSASAPGSCDASCEGLGVVRAVTWAGQQHGSELTFRLPAPFIRNMYIQRGYFLDSTCNNGVMNGTLTLDVCFPQRKR